MRGEPPWQGVQPRRFRSSRAIFPRRRHRNETWPRRRGSVAAT